MDRINSKYKRFFFVADSSSSKVDKKINCIRYDHYEEFFSTLIRDEDIPWEIRCLFGVIVVGGCRISEVLTIAKNRIEKTSEGEMYIQTRVLMKKPPKKGIKGKFKRKSDIPTRKFYVPKELIPWIEILMKNRRPYEFIFSDSRSQLSFLHNFNRHKAYNAIKKHLGEDVSLNSLRNAFITYLAYQVNYDENKVAKIMNISKSQIYKHTNPSDKLETKKIFQNSGLE